VRGELAKETRQPSMCGMSADRVHGFGRLNVQNTSRRGSAKRRGSADDLVGLEEEGRGHRETQGLDELEVEAQLNIAGRGLERSPPPPLTTASGLGEEDAQAAGQEHLIQVRFAPQAVDPELHTAEEEVFGLNPQRNILHDKVLQAAAE
jgi:hypothetical protein